MSTNIDCDQTFLGLPLLKVRNALKAWRYGWTTDAHDIALRKDVDLNPRMAMVLLEELRDRGLIGPKDQEYLGQSTELPRSGTPSPLRAAINGRQRIGHGLY